MLNHSYFPIERFMFDLDDRIQSTSFFLGDWPLSRVVLKNEKTFPWLILVPRKTDVYELFHLEHADRFVLIEEVNALSHLVHDYFKPDKLNIGTLGNVVPQFHIHVVGRRADDPLWPQGVWQENHVGSPYHELEIAGLIADLQDAVQLLSKSINQKI